MVAHGGTGRDALAYDDLYVRDLQMPELGGVDTARALIERDPETAIVMITRHARSGVLRRALAAGVRGFVPKSTSTDDLARVIERVHAGGRYVDPELAVASLGFDRPPTDPEVDALRLTHDGLTVAESAARLHLARGTVRNYLSDAIAKLGVTTRHATAREARSNGWSCFVSPSSRIAPSRGAEQ